ncbi:MAG: sigma-70 family RNA polymerase sigma factor [Bacteroidetes bacterium]|nr:sigma-70 family RNA polymerase sigma factor [Bacteroidota bacterium]
MNNQLISDKELLNQYIAGNDLALEHLIKTHKDKIFTSIYFIVRDHALAEDIFQETFIKVINTLKKGGYKHEGKFAQWVMRIAYNLSIDHFRKVKRMPTIKHSGATNMMDYLNIPEENVEDKMIKDQTCLRVRSLIDGLPSEQKQVVILRHYVGMSFKEISKMTNVSINTALGRMRYALNNIRKSMQEKNVTL